MKRFFNFILMAAIAAFACTSIYAQSERYKWEGFGGYSYMNLNRGVDPDEFNDNFSDFPSNRVNAHGFNGSVVYNWSRYLGVKFDFTAHTHGEDFVSSLSVNPPPPGGNVTNATFKTSQSVYQYLFGIQVKNNKKDGPKFKPWGQMLFGASHQKFSVDETVPNNQHLFELSSTDFGMKFGGGIDYRVHKNVDIRFIEFDWNPIVRGDLALNNGFAGTINGNLQNNWLLTFGVAFH